MPDPKPMPDQEPMPEGLNLDTENLQPQVESRNQTRRQSEISRKVNDRRGSQPMQWGEVDDDLTSPKKKHTEEAGMVPVEPTAPIEHPGPKEIPESDPKPTQNPPSLVDNSEQSNPENAAPELPPAPPSKPAPE